MSRVALCPFARNVQSFLFYLRFCVFNVCFYILGYFEFGDAPITMVIRCGIFSIWLIQFVRVWRVPLMNVGYGIIIFFSIEKLYIRKLILIRLYFYSLSFTQWKFLYGTNLPTRKYMCKKHMYTRNIYNKSWHNKR